MNPNTIDRFDTKQLTVLLFYSADNPLQEINYIEEQIKELKTPVDFFKINIHTNPKMGESFQVTETPLVLGIINGKVVWRYTYASSENTFVYLLSGLEGNSNGQQV